MQDHQKTREGVKKTKQKGPEKEAVIIWGRGREGSKNKKQQGKTEEAGKS